MKATIEHALSGVKEGFTITLTTDDKTLDNLLAKPPREKGRAIGRSGTTIGKKGKGVLFGALNA